MIFDRLTHTILIRVGLLLNVLFICLLTTTSVAAGQVYKYVDESGKIHYSDHPFTYRQKNFSATNNDKAYNPKKDSLKTNIILGLWVLVAHSRHLGNDTLPSSGKWQFNSDGTLLISQGKQSNKTEYRAQNHSLEVLDKSNWSQYRIVSLSESRLVIHNGKNGEKGKYLYFNKSRESALDLSKKARKKPATLYRRDQVAKLMTMFSCTGVKFSELNEDERKGMLKEIFNNTGIEKFNETIYENSVKQYKKDTIFKEQYQPQVHRDINNCKAPKNNTN